MFIVRRPFISAPGSGGIPVFVLWIWTFEPDKPSMPSLTRRNCISLIPNQVSGFEVFRGVSNFGDQDTIVTLSYILSVA